VEPRIQVRGDRQAEHRVAQEGEPLVRVAALLDPRGMRDRLAGKILRQSFQQV
jgi:hypothetical protein